MKGRKRFLLVDTLGLVWALWVTAGSVSEAEGAKHLFRVVRDTMGPAPGGLVRWRLREPH